MDGNRRWAKAKGRALLKGHEAGGETLKKSGLNGRGILVKTDIILYIFY